MCFNVLKVPFSKPCQGIFSISKSIVDYLPLIYNLLSKYPPKVDPIPLGSIIVDVPRIMCDFIRSTEIRLMVVVSFVLFFIMTWSRPRCPLRSHYLCIKNHLFIVGIGPILKKELGFIFQSDLSVRTYVYS